MTFACYEPFWLKRSRLLGAACAALLALTPLAARAEYRLQSGDVLQFAAAGLPELKQSIRVDLDGIGSFPLIGSIPVGGKTVAEVRALLQQAYPSAVLRSSTTDGRERLMVIDPKAISVQVEEYRPIYVNGDVSQPGQQAYRPGLTVRQAIALAGGLDVMRYRTANPFIASAELRSEHEVLWLDFAREQVRVLRLQSELGEGGPTAWHPMETPIAATTMASIEQLVREQQDTRRQKFVESQRVLQAQIASINEQIAFISTQHGTIANDIQRDQGDVARSERLVTQGLASVLRASEDRHSLQNSRIRYSQSVLQKADLEKARGDIELKVAQLTAERRVELLTELEEARAKLASIQSKLRSSSDRILYVGLIKSQLVRGLGSHPSVQIVRAGKMTPATEESELRPGDTVEIALDPTVTGTAGTGGKVNTAATR